MCTSHKIFLTWMNVIWDCYLHFVRHYGDFLPGVFDPLPFLDLPKVCITLFELATFNIVCKWTMKIHIVNPQIYIGLGWKLISLTFFCNFRKVIYMYSVMLKLTVAGNSSLTKDLWVIFFPSHVAIVIPFISNIKFCLFKNFVILEHDWELKNEYYFSFRLMFWINSKSQNGGINDVMMLIECQHYNLPKPLSCWGIWALS